MENWRLSDTVQMPSNSAHPLRRPQKQKQEQQKKIKKKNKRKKKGS